MQRLLLSALAGFLFATAAAAQGNTISVQGNVNAPGTFTVDADGMTLLGAIGRAGGVQLDAGETATIYRPDESGTLHQIKVALKSILAHKAPDVPLRPGDVVFVPGPLLDKPVIDDRLIKPRQAK